MFGGVLLEEARGELLGEEVETDLEPSAGPVFQTGGMGMPIDFGVDCE